MNLGVVLPTVELGADPAIIREYAQTAQGHGYTHLVIQDHVLGVDPAVHVGWTRPYTNKTLTPDPFVQSAFLSSAVPGMELVTGVVVLTQRQTVLVAKQAAEVDILTGGNFRLGVGLGWNKVEYDALGEDFTNRGVRSEEQVELMRALWTQQSVKFDGKWHHIDAAGINPMPVQRPIPVWFGGASDAVLRRIARMGDGWITSPQVQTYEANKAMLCRLYGFAEEIDRDPATIGIEGRIELVDHPTDADVLAAFREWREMDVGIVTLSTRAVGLDTPRQQVDALKHYKDLADSI
jgi:probable F420-dependent oxidoreductase